MIFRIGKYWIIREGIDKWLNFRLNFDFLGLRSLLIKWGSHDLSYWRIFLFFFGDKYPNQTYKFLLSVLQSLRQCQCLKISYYTQKYLIIQIQRSEDDSNYINEKYNMMFNIMSHSWHLIVILNSIWYILFKVSACIKMVILVKIFCLFLFSLFSLSSLPFLSLFLSFFMSDVLQVFLVLFLRLLEEGWWPIY